MAAPAGTPGRPAGSKEYPVRERSERTDAHGGERTAQHGGAGPPPLRPTRTTAAAAALVLRGDRLLLVRQRRRSGDRWEVPGGGQEAGESLEETAVREVIEEAGLVVAVDQLVATYVSYRLHTGTVVMGGFYLARDIRPDAAPTPQVDDGIVEAAFVDPATLADADLGPLTRRVLTAWWPRRHLSAPPFHVELWRTRTGYLPG